MRFPTRTAELFPPHERIAREIERRPVLRIGVVRVAQHAHLGRAQCVGCGLAGAQAPVEFLHQGS